MKPIRESGPGLIALAMGGALALNYPLLALFDRDTAIFGIPMPFVHLFVVWALLIAGVAALVERCDDDIATELDASLAPDQRQRAAE